MPVTLTHNSFCSSFYICKPAADERQKPLHLHFCDPCSGKHALRHNNTLLEHHHHQHCSQADTLAAAADSELGLNSFLRCFAYCYSLRHPGQRERKTLIIILLLVIIITAPALILPLLLPCFASQLSLFSKGMSSSPEDVWSKKCRNGSHCQSVSPSTALDL